MNNFSFHILCTSLGRESLSRLIDSFVNQLNVNDYFTIVSDGNHDFVEGVLSTFNFKCKLNHIKNLNGPEGNFGHPLLNRHMNTLDGDFIMFADDDDRYVPDAFEYIRNTVMEKKLYIFQHKWGGTVNWASKHFEVGNIGKCIGVIPNTKNLPLFHEDIFGDGIFYSDISKIFEYEFIDKIIYKVRDTE
jgi:hypothetical protein